MHKRRLFSFSTHEFGLHAPLCRTFALNSCLFFEKKGVDHKITEQISVVLEVHRIAVNPFGYLIV